MPKCWDWLNPNDRNRGHYRFIVVVAGRFIPSLISSVPNAVVSSKKLGSAELMYQRGRKGGLGDYQLSVVLNLVREIALG